MTYCIDCGGVAIEQGECKECQHIRAWSERASGRGMAGLSKECYVFMFEHFAALHYEMAIDSRREGYEVAQEAAKDHGQVWAMAEHFKHFSTQMMAFS